MTCWLVYLLLVVLVLRLVGFVWLAGILLGIDFSLVCGWFLCFCVCFLGCGLFVVFALFDCC